MIVRINNKPSINLVAVVVVGVLSPTLRLHFRINSPARNSNPSLKYPSGIPIMWSKEEEEEKEDVDTEEQRMRWTEIPLFTRIKPKWRTIESIGFTSTTIGPRCRSCRSRGLWAHEHGLSAPGILRFGD